VLTWIAERGMSVRQLAGVLVALGGIVVLYSRDLHLGAASGWGGLELLAAAACYAAGAVYIQRVIPDVPPLATAAAAMTVSAIAMIPFAVTAGFPVPDLATALWLIVLAVAATGGALVLFYALIRSAGAVRANLAGYLAPVFAVAYGSVFLGEAVHYQDVAGLALILAGSFLAAA
jgi:drug/metabolite transporter (DMT)-like permease